MPTPAEIERLRRIQSGQPLPGPTGTSQPISPISFGGGTQPGLGGFNVDPRITQHVDFARSSRDRDMGDGERFGKQYFGEGNADMSEIIAARKAAAYGTDPTVDLQRAQGVNNINQTMQTATRGLMSRLAGSGVRGGAAGGAAIPIARDALNARQGLETDLAINEQKRRDTALSGLESTLTGERSGLLSSIFGFAGLGAQDRGNALQTILGQDYLKSLQPPSAPPPTPTPTGRPSVGMAAPKPNTEYVLPPPTRGGYDSRRLGGNQNKKKA